MPAERLPMRRIKEILRLRWECRLSARQIARSLKIARSTVAEYLRRATAAGLSISQTKARSLSDITAYAELSIIRPLR
jgi:DNA-binding transcriptional regulator LsrR (DeoR family)